MIATVVISRTQLVLILKTQKRLDQMPMSGHIGTALNQRDEVCLD